ncbi:dienelactone hydrolase [Trinickia symbiotica]|uniref:Dienelactone hydrolase n=1 Tax=Trinickia symbiotica TaxID=863227 RepID=A0A2N7X2F0_9BURK|nr:dienelactone hydrolase family protein [Trinickia symbiotica]PMS35916.1 dienelactone hydrolase [Trinickia symbiotica]PPK44432.1 dienelactone hydrolase [Trinickia symbiotica]
MTPNSMLSRLVSHLSLIAVIVLSQMAAAQTLSPEREGRIEFNSFTPKTMYDLAREHRENWAEQTVWGDLSLPKSDAAKVPAIVLMHGSGGVEASMAQWVQAFNEIGVATFVVYVFEPRGVNRTAEDQTRVPYAADVVDAFQALQVLASHPRIDATRIGIMGFSRGGSATFRTAEEPFRRAVIKTDLKFALHIPVYAGCNQVYWSPQITKAPILNLVGEADDYTLPEPCERLARRYADAGATVRTIEYAGAGHSWDGMYPVSYQPRATSAAPCGVLRWDIEPWTITSERTGETIDPPKLNEFFAGCSKLGAHVGRNEAAFRKSRSDAQAFVREVFFASQ